MVQRMILSRVVRSYRTTSTDALCVLSGCPPWELLIDERARIYTRLRAPNIEAQTKGNSKSTVRKEERSKTLTLWQAKWDACTSGRATYKFIRNIKAWIEWGPKIINHHLIQILAGHGCFGAYKNRIGKAATSNCWFCESTLDDVENTLFVCKQ